MKSGRILCAAALIAFSPAVLAEGMAIDPGLWEISTTVTMEIMPQPQTRTVTECFTESEVTPESFADQNSSECDFDVQEVSKNAMKWTVACQVEGGSTSGEWEATSSGSVLLGKGAMAMEFQGRAMTMSMEWSGKRVGACP